MSTSQSTVFLFSKYLR